MREQNLNFDKKLGVELSKSNILSSNDLDKLNSNIDLITFSLNNAQIFRTDTEAKISVLNDVKFPSVDSKYWQSMKELKVMSDQLFILNSDYKLKLVDLEEIENKINSFNYDNDFDKKRDLINLEKIKYEIFQMELTAKDRIREIEMWSKIINDLKPKLKYSSTNVNEHQLLSYGERFINEYISILKLNSSLSSGESINIMGLLKSNLETIKNNGLQQKFLEIVNPEVKNFLIQNKLMIEGASKND